MKRSTLILAGALVLSLSVNLGVAGLTLGRYLRDAPGPTDRYLGALPESLRHDVREAMKPRTPEIRQRIEAMRDARRAVNRALRARPFDPEAANRALADLRTETTYAQEHLHQTIVERMAAAQAAGTLPPPPGPKDEKGPPKGPPEGPGKPK